MLDDGRARLEVVLEPERVDHDLHHTLGHLVDSAKYPGFRPGKVPPAVVLQRMGREEVFEETMREHLALVGRRGDRRGPPAPGRSPERRFRGSAGRGRVVHVHGRVPAAAQGHAARRARSSRACRRTIDVPAEEVDAEIERLREESSPLVAVDRAAQTGDYVEVDMHVSANGKPVPEASTVGYLVQLGTGRTFEEIERTLRGMSAGETRHTELPLPAEYPDPKLRGRNADVELHVHSVREREPRPLDDDFARAASEFDTLAELRTAIEDAYRERLEAIAQLALPRERARLARRRHRGRAAALHGRRARRGAARRSRAQRRAPGRAVRDVPGADRPHDGAGHAGAAARRDRLAAPRARARGVRRAREHRDRRRRARERAARRAGRRGRRGRRGAGGPRVEGEGGGARRAAAPARARPGLRDRDTDQRRAAAAREQLWTPGDDEKTEPAVEKPTIWTPGQPR